MGKHYRFGPLATARGGRTIVPWYGFGRTWTELGEIARNSVVSDSVVRNSVVRDSVDGETRA